MADEGWIDTAQQGDTLVLRAGGRWLVTGAAALDRQLRQLAPVALPRVRIDLRALEALDTVGAWLVLRTHMALASQGKEVSIDGPPPALQPVFRQVEARHPALALPPGWQAAGFREALAFVGRATIEVALRTVNLLGFFGLVTISALDALRRPRRVRVVSLVSQMERAGVSALPIVGVLSLLMGIVIAFQGADQLRPFGAELLTVNLLGLSFLRELGAVLTAIIVAGRSGSAFTAEIGAMQVNEEVDAMRTLGLDPIEVLVLPRLFGLTLTMPLLTFYANLVGLLGGALMCWLTLDIPLPVFLQQLRASITGWSFWLGILKAPFFAASIAVIGCFEGLRVSRSAESVGRLTTVSVVESIFLVIVIDAGFSVLFAKLGI